MSLKPSQYWEGSRFDTVKLITFYVTARRWLVNAKMHVDATFFLSTASKRLLRGDSGEARLK
jgi:hypothetical protein